MRSARSSDSASSCINVRTVFDTSSPMILLPSATSASVIASTRSIFFPPGLHGRIDTVLPSVHASSNELAQRSASPYRDIALPSLRGGCSGDTQSSDRRPTQPLRRGLVHLPDRGRETLRNLAVADLETLPFRTPNEHQPARIDLRSSARFSRRRRCRSAVI